MLQQQKIYLRNLQKYFRKRVKIMPKCAILTKFEQSSRAAEQQSSRAAEQQRLLLCLQFRQRTKKFNAHPFIYCPEKISRPIMFGGVCA